MLRGVPKETIESLRSDLAKQGKTSIVWERHEQKAFKKGYNFAPYAMYDDTLEDFEYTFSDIDVLKSARFETYLEQRFGERVGNLVGLELGGPGANFFGGFREGMFAKTAGVTILDLRSRYQNQEEKQRDNRRHHEIIEGDIFSKQALKNVDEWLKGKTVDFIVERMQGGWGVNHQSLPIFAKYFARWYEKLGKDGVMFLQTPFVGLTHDKIDSQDVKKYFTWIELLQKKYGGLLTITAKQSVIKVEKLPNAPQKISVFNF